VLLYYHYRKIIRGLILLSIFVMKLTSIFPNVSAVIYLTSATILENGRPRPTNYPDPRIDPNACDWNTNEADTHELSYKGRWENKHISWWS